VSRRNWIPPPNLRSGWTGVGETTTVELIWQARPRSSALVR
jgi:hypothetical protein